MFSCHRLTDKYDSNEAIDSEDRSKQCACVLRYGADTYDNMAVVITT